MIEQELDESQLPDLPAETPEQECPVKWEFKPRKNPRWGEVTRQGLIVGRGANQRVVPPDEVYKLASLGCTIEEISDWFGVNRETIKYNFWEYIQKGYSETRQRLRQAMLRNALNGNAALQIFLAKNMLGMSDNPVQTDETKVLPWTDE